MEEGPGDSDRVRRAKMHGARRRREGERARESGRRHVDQPEGGRGVTCVGTSAGRTTDRHLQW
jgi:hypothetical protein